MKQKLFTLLIALFAIVGTASARNYSIDVCDVTVTDANKADVLGDGTVTYNSATNKLTLHNAKIVLKTGNAGISVGLNGLEIVLEGSNRIEATNGSAGYGINCDYYAGSNIVFSGTGSLYIEGCVPGTKYRTTCGIHSSNSHDGTITINGGDITVACNGDNAIFSEDDIVINGGTVTVLSSKGGGIVDNNGTTINGGIVMAETYYSSLRSTYGNITINGGKVTAKSANSYGIISTGSVEIAGGTVTATSKSVSCIDAGNSVNIKGGTVTASSEKSIGISCDGIVNIKGGIVEATGGNLGIYCKEGLSVYSTARLLEGDAAPGSVVSALTNTYSLGSTSSIFWTKKYVKISPRLVITTQPQNVTITKGETATLSVVVTGGVTPYTYQWRQYNNSNKKWESISGATSSTFKVKPTETTMYYCEVHDADANQLLSDNATVTVKDPLTITKQPENETIIKGGTVTLSVVAAGGIKPYTYQWWRLDNSSGNWVSISGATSITYSPVTTADGVLEYRCVITDAAGNTVTSNEVTVTVKSDVTSPTVSDKTISVKEVTSSKIWVTWNAAKDNITTLVSMKYKVFCVDDAATVLGIFLVFVTNGKVEELPVSYETTGARSATVTKYIDKEFKLQNLEAGKEYTVFIYALDKAGNYAEYDPVTVQVPATGIDNATADEKTVSDVKYFAPDGRAVTSTAKGLVIRKTIYTDGTVKTDKVRK